MNAHPYVWSCACAACRKRTRYYRDQVAWWVPRVLSMLDAAKRGRSAVVDELRRQGFRVVITPDGLLVRLDAHRQTTSRRLPARGA